MQNLLRLPVPIVIFQHVSDAASLRTTRVSVVAAPHVKLLHLTRIDERIAAHLDGAALAGEFGLQMAREMLESPTRGEVFLATVRALEDSGADLLDDLFALAAVSPEQFAGLASAYGWVSAPILKGVVSELLAHHDPFRQRVGVVACRLHRADPGAALAQVMSSANALLRACAMRCAGEVGRRDLLPVLVLALDDEDPECQFRAAQSSALLGERGGALAALTRLALQPGPFRAQALALALFAANASDARELVGQIAKQREDVRLLIRAVGLAGDVEHIDWLTGLMADDKLARIAGESFSFITGADLAWLDLERKPPEHFESGPNDNPEDEDVAMDEDDGLPWPDQAKVRAWWTGNSHRFQPGVRYFTGAPPSWDHCLQVLRDGYQRQRIAAAHYLCLLRPGTPLFNCAAPAWRQKRLLARMS